MNEFEQQMLDRGFVITKKVLINGKGLYIDSENKKWTITGSSMKKLRRFGFDQIIEFELFEDGNSVLSGRSGSAFVGGVLAGTTGALIGGAGKKVTSDQITTMQLRITLNDLKTPSIIFNFPFGFLNASVERGTSQYRELSEKAHEMISLLQYMVTNASQLAN